MLPVNLKQTDEVPTRLLGADQGQAVAEYAFILLVLLFLLGLATALGIRVGDILDWISLNI